jgi:hypothetical protein
MPVFVDLQGTSEGSGHALNVHSTQNVMHPDFGDSSGFSSIGSDEEENSGRLVYQHLNRNGTVVHDATEDEANMPRTSSTEHTREQVDAGDSGEMPALLQSFLGKLDSVERQLKGEWEDEQQTRLVEAGQLPPPQRSLSSGFPHLSLRCLPSSAEDIVAGSRAGMRTTRTSGVGMPPSCALAHMRSTAQQHSARTYGVDWQPSAQMFGLDGQSSVRGFEAEGQQNSRMLASFRAQLSMTQRRLEEVEATSSPKQHALAVPSLQLGLFGRGSAGLPVDVCVSGEQRQGTPQTEAPSVGAINAALLAAGERLVEVERLVVEKMEPLARHITGMKRRMLSAQEEAKELREELEAQAFSSSAEQSPDGASGDAQVCACCELVHSHNTGLEAVWVACADGLDCVAI